MHKKLSILLLLSILLPFPTFATFNPNFILSNNDLTDYTTMGMDEIHNFLKEKGGILYSYIDLNIRMTTAQIIFDSSWAYKINPKYLLVLLQKEQSLVTSPNPTQSQLDWATGYGCPDSGSCNQKYKGLGTQIDWGAGGTRYYLDNPEKFKYQTGKTYTIDETEVTMLNDATRALYTYTPHIHGNGNLYNIWADWFSKNYPDGTILQSTEDGGIWLLQNNLKRPFLTKSAFASRYSFDKIISVSKTELEKYASGAPIKYANYSLLRIPTGGVYLLDNDKLRPITSSKAFRLLGFNPEEIIDVKETEIKEYPISEAITIESSYPVGGLLQDKTTGGVYYVQNGKKAPIWSKDLMKLYYSKLKLTQVTADELKNYPTQEPVKFKDGELVKAADNSTVYVISNSQRRPIPTEKVFDDLGYKWENVIVTREKILELHQLGESLSAQE